MLEALRRYEIRWILSGSTVLAAYSSDLFPNDLDVTPSLEGETYNVQRRY